MTRRPPPAPVPIPSPAKARAMVEARDGRQCARCPQQGTPWHVDHIFPLWLVDPIDPERWRYWLLDNLQTLCASCHQAKTNSEAASRAKIRRIVSKVRTPMGAKRKARARRPALPF